MYNLAPALKKHVMSRQAMLLAVDDHQQNHIDIVTMVKSWHQELLEKLHQYLLQHQDGVAICQARALFIDNLLKTLFQQRFSAADKLCLIATGGYGRAELAPASDLDIWFITQKDTDDYNEKIEEILYILWDCGFKVGHSVRCAPHAYDIIQSDHTIVTAFLEARHIAGVKAIWQELHKKCFDKISDKKSLKFMNEKLQERELRHYKYGNTRYMVEPHIKEGKGGLRDVHCLAWIALYHYRLHNINQIYDLDILTSSEKKLLRKSWHFLTSLRCHIHFTNHSGDERLTFDIQPNIAEYMGYKKHGNRSAVERLMKHYHMVAKQVGDLTRIFLHLWYVKTNEKQQYFAFLQRTKDIDGFPLENNRLRLPKVKDETTHALNMIKIFKLACAHNIDIHPSDLQMISRQSKIIQRIQNNNDANHDFVAILTAKNNQENILRLMSECGALGAFIPDFAKVIAQMQFDMYHVYTTDEHTLHAIGNLNDLENGVLKDDHPLASQEFSKIPDRIILYIAVFLHDIAKGRNGDHSILGAQVAQELCPRLGLNTEQTDLVSWLILHHLAMSKTAFRRDLQDMETIAAFADLVKSTKRLRYLLILTVIDIRSVGPNVWKSWQAVLLRMLYQRTFTYLTGGQDALQSSEDRADIYDALSEKLPEITRDNIVAILSLMRDDYFNFTPLEIMAAHIRMIKSAQNDNSDLVVDYQPIHDDQSTRFDIYCHDRLGIFCELAGAIGLSGGQISHARISTLNNDMVLDSFVVQDKNNQPISAQKARLIVNNIHDVLAQKIDLHDGLYHKAQKAWRRNDKAFYVKPRVLFDNDLSIHHTILEVAGRDRDGLLYFITNVIRDAGLKIISAKIATYGEKAVDAFYVKDKFGHKIIHRDVQQQLQHALMLVLNQANEGIQHQHINN